MRKVRYACSMQQILQCIRTEYTFNKPQQLLQIHLDIKKYGSRAPVLTMI